MRFFKSNKLRGRNHSRYWTGSTLFVGNCLVVKRKIMQYVIYQIKSIDLPSNEPVSCRTKETDQNVLVEIDVPQIKSRHIMYGLAVHEIEKQRALLKFKKLTVLPIFDIGWDGEIRCQ